MDQIKELTFAAQVADAPEQPDAGEPFILSATNQALLSTIDAKLSLLLSSQGIEYDESGDAKG